MYGTEGGKKRKDGKKKVCGWVGGGDARIGGNEMMRR